LQRESISELRVMEPSDRPFRQLIDHLALNVELSWQPNNQFFWSQAEFDEWAANRKRLVLEDFYRASRKRFDILMADGKPLGDRWNFDKENRKPPKGELNTPTPLEFQPDAITQAVIDRVQADSFSSYGELEPFRWAVTRAQALQVLNHFLAQRLPHFGPYQDAMVTSEPTMWHALLSPYLNLGLLHPREVVAAAERIGREQDFPLNGVEGFIRQVLGWREYMRGLYHHLPADYGDRNWFEHTQPLPAFFWDAAQTEMNCLHQVLRQVEQTGYAHHIQRLMILSNFALIAGVSPQALEAWFHAAFVDAYDWVMQTNVLGMGQFADGGILASKPYCSSANYINRMSDYCQNCGYNRSDRTGPKACPFNYFYWDFLARQRDRLQHQGRMNFILKNLDRMSADEHRAIDQQARDWWQTAPVSESA
ncbi:MAG: cryptochrome/photolyase family protein, partial [Spirulinaceae cyanobacterium RM2_2_10]|nr:cryptochrome/photolyase family protein [Spirulinaceae cyanobacterium RM2_2_10]